MSPELFAEHRGHLFAIAYRMLGSRAEAEDIVQDVWLRVSATNEEIQTPRAYLATVASRMALDRLKSARARRETYVGPWLPEPMLLPPDDDERQDTRLGRAESVSLALLLVLETLSPLERAVLLLREIFDYDFAAISQMLETSEAACRQLLHRAKSHVEARHRRHQPSRAMQERLAAAFFTAIQAGDTDAVAQLLTEDARVISDGGGRVSAAQKIVTGRDHVARMLIGLGKRAAPHFRSESAWINGAIGLVVRDGEHPVTVIALDNDGSHVSAVHMILNPDKLALINKDIE